MTQSDALRLADELRAAPERSRTSFEAAAELRRLHGLDFALRNCEQALKNMATKYMDTVDQRDALLEALGKCSDQLTRLGYSANHADQAIAAIKAVEEGKE